MSTRLQFYEGLRFSWYFLSLKSFGNSWGTSHIPCFLLIITLHFTCGFKENIKKPQSIITDDFAQNFISVLMSSLTAPSVRNSHFLAVIYFIFLKKHARPNLKGFQYKIWASVKRSEKLLSSKTHLSLFCKSLALI